MIKAITGTKDILPEEVVKWRYLEKIVHDVFEKFGYKEIRTRFSKKLHFLQGVSAKQPIS
ncbi:MAG: hypothetical protein U5K00_11330 [Melioribacteraceae bacterium]|nr:hypothetical protein [Melioribacteraceae bacterium]